MVDVVNSWTGCSVWDEETGGVGREVSFIFLDRWLVLWITWLIYLTSIVTICSMFRLAVLKSFS
jgi:hypothetical protein